MHDANGVAGYEEFFVGGDYKGFESRAFSGDLAFGADALFVLLWVYAEAGPLKALADLGADVGGVFAYASGEDEGVGASHGGEVRPDVLAGAVAEDIDGEADTAVVIEGELFEEDSHVVR